MKPLVLVMAGFDPSGGAGILRDVRAVEAAGGDARAAVTALTAQDERHFHGFQAVDPSLVRAQAHAAVEFAPPAAMKIGMLGSRDNCEAVADFLKDLPESTPVVLDPVLRSSTGGDLIDEATMAALRERLLPVATLVTPNVPEAEVLAGVSIDCVDHMVDAAAALLESGVRAVLVKGGHLRTDPVVDVLARRDQEVLRLEHPRMPGGIHGSGCLLSSTVATHLALGREMEEAVRQGAGVVLAEIRQTVDGRR